MLGPFVQNIINHDVCQRHHLNTFECIILCVIIHPVPPAQALGVLKKPLLSTTVIICSEPYSTLYEQYCCFVLSPVALTGCTVGLSEPVKDRDICISNYSVPTSCCAQRMVRAHQMHTHTRHKYAENRVHQIK